MHNWRDSCILLTNEAHPLYHRGSVRSVHPAHERTETLATIPRDPDVLDDLHYADGKEVPADEKILLAVDGKTYGLDLTTQNADQLRADLQPWLSVAVEIKPAAASARRASGGGGGKSSSTARSQRELTSRIREWADGQNIKLNEKGRIPNEVRDSYFDVHPEDKPA